LLRARLGAEVIKIEPPESNATRRIGPSLENRPGSGFAFAQRRTASRASERSLFPGTTTVTRNPFWTLRESSARERLLFLLGGNQPYLGWALVHLARDGRAGSEEPCAIAVEIRHASRFCSRHGRMPI
jgi:hypothetical protein